MRAGIALPLSVDGRGNKIRTCDPRFPKPVLYQAELCPENRANRLRVCGKKGKGGALVDARRKTADACAMLGLDKPLPFGINARNWYWFLLGFAAVLALALLGDTIVSRSFTTWPEPVRGFFFWITDWGLADWILVPALKLFLLALGLAAIVHDRAVKLALVEVARLFGFIFVGVGLPSLIANLIKRAIGRGRPVVLDSVGDLDFRYFVNDWDYQSFPSGHATTIFALVTVVGFLRPSWFLWVLPIALLVGISRIVVGMHYPTDVLGGAVCGVLLAYAVRNGFALRRWVFERRPDGSIAVRPFSAVRRLFRSRD
jgi:membrane-associated phospholipid phosphatase